MNRVSLAVLLGFVALGAAVLVVPRHDYRQREGGPRIAPSAVRVLPAATTTPIASITPPTLPDPPPDAPPAAAEDGEDEGAKAGLTMPGGSAVPELGNAPKHVKFGAVLVTYAGAQGAPRGARSKAEAEKLALQLAETAKTDFAAAVKDGDHPGSLEEAGTMYRGILEPAPEYVLFSLAPDQVGGPVDTPRGFWVVKRLK
jgi:hypothetical protein